MDNISVLQLAVYVSYLFVIIAYAVKAIKYVKTPLHLRWELYPIAHEKGRGYGSSYYEDLEWWNKPRRTSILGSINYLLKNYAYFWEYYRKKKSYWLLLYPWHIGFYLIVIFHALAFFGALAMVFGLSVSGQSANILTRSIYYLTLIVAVGSFVTGSFGSIGLFIKRLGDEDLRDYTPIMNYFNYLFFLAVFLSGLCAWYFFDPTLSEYREFWKGVITFRAVDVAPATATHIILFSLFLTYLPFTRSTHYITKLFAFFWVRWDDAPNLRGSKIREKVSKVLDQRVSWSAPHIQSGKKWSEIATEVKYPDQTESK